MRLTPIEIRSHRFSTRLRGYDAVEVEAFLETVVADFEEVVRENAQLRRESERLGRELDTHRGREQNIQQTLTTAQGVVENLKRTALKEAEVLVSEAELRSEKLLAEAHANRNRVELEIAELKHLRNRLAAEVRQTVERYLSMMDAYDDAHRSAAERIDEVDPEPEET